MTNDPGNRLPAQWVGGIFKSVDWPIPAYLQWGFITRLALSIESVEPEHKLTVARDVLALVYNHHYIASFYLHKYSQTEHIKDFSCQIDEVFRAYFSGYKHVAIAAMLPILEGIVRQIANRANRNAGPGTQGVLREFESLVNDEAASPSRYDERLVMFELLRDFMRDRFLKKTDLYSGFNQFNRHGILHGVFDEYGEDINFLRLITLLDLLCFVIGYRFGGVSCFAPDKTTESDRLAAEYIALQSRSTQYSPSLGPSYALDILLGKRTALDATIFQKSP